MNKDMEIVFITGISGSGKTTALNALEDIRYFCIDNFPLDIFNKFIELIEYANININKLAIACDIRDINIEKKLKSIKEELNKANIASTIVFLESNKDIIIKRYEQTRRSHPLTLLIKNISLSDAIEKEFSIMEKVKEISDIDLNTSYTSPNELRRFIFNKFSTNRHLAINLISFGFKYGIPIESDNVFDVRFITNPYFIDKFRNTTGLEKETYDFVISQKETQLFLNNIKPVLKNLIPLYEKEGKSYLTISIGCTGGKHRSVAITEYVKKIIETMEFDVNIFHRDLER